MVALWLAARDPRVPFHAKAVAATLAAHALSPIDLIPDFIPLLGYLDDLLIVPLGIIVVVGLVPRPVMAVLRIRAAQQGRASSTAGLAVILLLWLSAAAFVAWQMWPRQHPLLFTKFWRGRARGFRPETQICGRSDSFKQQRASLAGACAHLPRPVARDGIREMGARPNEVYGALKERIFLPC